MYSHRATSLQLTVSHATANYVSLDQYTNM
jgi:hypothetical protein